jgi:hypothetical protein
MDGTDVCIRRRVLAVRGQARPGGAVMNLGDQGDRDEWDSVSD